MLSPKIRENCDLFIFFRQNSRAQIERIIDSYLSGLEASGIELNKGEGYKFYKNLMKRTFSIEHTAIVFDCLNGDGHIENTLFKYRV